MNFEDYQYLFKFVLIGDTGVGKSCFLSQYIKGKFIQEYDPTIGLEFESKSIEFNDGIVVQNQLWDTSGSSQFMAIQKTFCQNAAGAIIFYKIDSQNSFKSLENWISILKQVSSDQIQIIIVATHKDLENQRQVQTQQGRNLADSLDAKFYEISNHDKDQIDGIINSLSYNVLRLINTNKINPLNTQYGIKMSRQQEQQYASQQDNADDNFIQQQSSPNRRGSDSKIEQNSFSSNKVTASPQRPQQEKEQKEQNQQQNKPSFQLLYILLPIIIAYWLYQILL
ncbi:unnamed protein product [Paramecium sonneborni]|uniref:Uncharacterized protein n=1 Tax=Paramecium sonneborni TaxID=65129 RepID=A0A8S1NIN1_9CILI|nr:unnamed protein product [Paramecium sonneborni]